MKKLIIGISGTLITFGGASAIFAAPPGEWLIPMGVMLVGIAVLMTTMFYTSAGGLVNLLDKHTGYYDEQSKQKKDERRNTGWSKTGRKL